ncbi:aspartate/glutamate racemase family protein, partial [Hydrogenophaga aromaticivorans]|uniref:aspartate/glutamate racemase family protein n=1 Tax=Hydrogenophaga aromaticivorans TaxID=2610898 RepID=UPI001FFD898B
LGYLVSHRAKSKVRAWFNALAMEETIARGRDAAHQLGVQAVILGGAGLAGMAAAIQSDVPVPVIDSVTAGTHWALRTPPLPPARSSPGFDIAWQGLSSEMRALAPTPAD